MFTLFVDCHYLHTSSKIATKQQLVIVKDLAPILVEKVQFRLVHHHFRCHTWNQTGAAGKMQLLPSFLVSVISCSGSLCLWNLVIVKFKVFYQDIVLSEYYIRRYFRLTAKTTRSLIEIPCCALFHRTKHKILPEGILLDMLKAACMLLHQAN